MFVVKADEVFATFIRADGDAFLREAGILFDVPYLEDPIGVESVDTSTSLITYHVDDVVML